MNVARVGLRSRTEAAGPVVQLQGASDRRPEEVTMRTSLFVAAACLSLHVAPAFAQQPGYPYPYPYPYQYQYPTQGPGPAAPVAQPQPPPAQTGGVVIIQSPLPVLVQPAPAQPPPPAAPAAGPGYYYPPPGWAAPIYSYPPPPYQQQAPRLPVYRAQPAPRSASPCRGSCPGNRPGASAAGSSGEDRARFFSVGLRLSALSLNQTIGGKNTTLGGGGIEVRFRSRGRVGLEASLESLHGDFEQGGAIRRDTVPLQLSLLVYIFPNADSRHFNLYFLGGAGVSSTRMQLIDPKGDEVQQDFREWDLHMGVGTELRFKWLALRADVRGLKLWRDDRDNDGRWYGDVDGAPVPQTSVGVQGTVGAAIWF